MKLVLKSRIPKKMENSKFRKVVKIKINLKAKIKMVVFIDQPEDKNIRQIKV